MTFLHTRPIAIHDLDVGGAWSDFRVDSERRQAALFRALVAQEQLLTVGMVGGAGVLAYLWSCEERTGSLTLRLARVEDRLDLAHILARRGAAAEAAHTLWAAAYIDDAKLQFDLPSPTASETAGHPVLFSNRPKRVLHLPRRAAERVPNRLGKAPLARFAHPLAPDQQTTLRVLDVGLGGCSLWRPNGMIPLAPGVFIPKVEVELDPETIFFTDLRIVSASRGQSHMQTLPMGEADGLRLGCAWQGLPPQAAESLRGWLRRGRVTRSRASVDDPWLERIALE